MIRLLAEDAERVACRVDLAPLADKAVLVTGASGLLGLNLVAAIQRSRARCIMAASRAGLPDWAVEAWQADRRLRQLSFDRPDPDAPRPEIIIHAAGYGQPSRFLAEPLETIKLNVRTTDALLSQMAPGGRFLFLSSSEVYSGAPAPHREGDIGSTAPDHPRAPYIEAKRCGEAVVHAYRAQGVAATVARPCLVYGPGTRAGDGRVLNSFIEQALTKGHIHMRDAGTARRAYCYVTDAVEMMLRVLLQGTQAVYNIGSPAVTDIHELAETIGDIAGVPVTLGEAGPMAGAPDYAAVNVNRWQDEFGPKDFVPLEAGLARTVEWQRGLYT